MKIGMLLGHQDLLLPRVFTDAQLSDIFEMKVRCLQAPWLGLDTNGSYNSDILSLQNPLHVRSCALALQYEFKAEEVPLLTSLQGIEGKGAVQLASFLQELASHIDGLEVQVLLLTCATIPQELQGHFQTELEAFMSIPLGNGATFVHPKVVDNHSMNTPYLQCLVGENVHLKDAALTLQNMLETKGLLASEAICLRNVMRFVDRLASQDIKMSYPVQASCIEQFSDQFLQTAMEA
jgi:hypothetical protein